ncbi:hypothetical protein V1507DRAFT_493294, partial [Lipomyces tetrasporus]
FPSSPTLTEKSVLSLVGKVFIVTGGNAGVGLELVKILYSKGGTVYVAGRSPIKIATEIESIKSIHTATPGHIKSLPLDLSDLATIPICASTFLAQESRLEVLSNNAGIAHVPVGSIRVQGHEAHVGTNCLGPFLLTKLCLLSFSEPRNPRPKPACVSYSQLLQLSTWTALQVVSRSPSLPPANHSKDKARNYSVSKAGNWLLASEFDKRTRKDVLVCVAQNPGNLATKSWDGVPWAIRMLIKPIMHEPKMGAYTELWAGFSQDLKCEDGGMTAVPWGRWHPHNRGRIFWRA